MKITSAVDVLENAVITIAFVANHNIFVLFGNAFSALIVVKSVSMTVTQNFVEVSVLNVATHAALNTAPKIVQTAAHAAFNDYQKNKNFIQVFIILIRIFSNT